MAARLDVIKTLQQKLSLIDSFLNERVDTRTAEETSLINIIKRKLKNERARLQKELTFQRMNLSSHRSSRETATHTQKGKENQRSVAGRRTTRSASHRARAYSTKNQLKDRNLRGTAHMLHRATTNITGTSQQGKLYTGKTFSSRRNKSIRNNDVKMNPKSSVGGSRGMGMCDGRRIGEQSSSLPAKTASSSSSLSSSYYRPNASESPYLHGLSTTHSDAYHAGCVQAHDVVGEEEDYGNAPIFEDGCRVDNTTRSTDHHRGIGDHDTHAHTNQGRDHYTDRINNNLHCDANRAHSSLSSNNYLNHLHSDHTGEGPHDTPPSTTTPKHKHKHKHKHKDTNPHTGMRKTEGENQASASISRILHSAMLHNYHHMQIQTTPQSMKDLLEQWRIQNPRGFSEFNNNACDHPHPHPHHRGSSNDRHGHPSSHASTLSSTLSSPSEASSSSSPTPTSLAQASSQSRAQSARERGGRRTSNTANTHTHAHKRIPSRSRSQHRAPSSNLHPQHQRAQHNQHHSQNYRTLGLEVKPEGISLNQIHKIKHQKAETLRETLDDVCCICLDEMKRKQKVSRLPYCQHVFHAVCISSWLQRSKICPMCKTSVVDPPPDYQPHHQLHHQFHHPSHHPSHHQTPSHASNHNHTKLRHRSINGARVHNTSTNNTNNSNSASNVNANNGHIADHQAASQLLFQSRSSVNRAHGRFAARTSTTNTKCNTKRNTEKNGPEVHDDQVFYDRNKPQQTGRGIDFGIGIGIGIGVGPGSDMRVNRGINCGRVNVDVVRTHSNISKGSSNVNSSATIHGTGVVAGTGAGTGTGTGAGAGAGAGRGCTGISSGRGVREGTVTSKKNKHSGSRSRQKTSLRREMKEVSSFARRFG